MNEPVDGPRANEFDTRTVNFVRDPDPHPETQTASNGLGMNYRTLSIDIPAAHWTPEVEYVFHNLLPDTLRLFAAKNVDYSRTNVADEIGVAGAWLKLKGKVDKLRGPLWEDRGLGAELNFEGVHEILQDMVGHAFNAMMKYERARGQVADMERQRTEESKQIEALRQQLEEERKRTARAQAEAKVQVAKESLVEAINATREYASDGAPHITDPIIGRINH